jgi:hypothetical protein
MDYVPNMLHSFNSADIGQIAYATALAPGTSQAPAPAPPLILPNPIARYDFNKYSASSATIPNDVPGGSDATINMNYYNSFDMNTPGNYYLSLYWDANGQSGGITLPYLSGITAVEIWIQYQYPYPEGWGQYFLDFRTGASSGYWITSSGGQNIGSDFNNAKIWFNTVGQVTDATNGTPNVVSTIAGNGWVQIVIYPSTSISDDIAFFMRFTGEQGMPVNVADILVYNAPFNDDVVKGLYNAKCSRYGLSPIV